MNRSKAVLVTTLVVISLVITAGFCFASEADDFKKLEARVKSFIPASQKAREQTLNAIRDLAVRLCNEEDFEPNEDNSQKISYYKTKFSERAKTLLVPVSEEYERLTKDIEQFSNSHRTYKDRAAKLQESLKAEAKKVARELKIAGMYKADEVVRGNADAKIRAATLWGVAKHGAMQSEFNCDLKEIPAAGGKADCLKVVEQNNQNVCVVYEFKPDGIQTNSSKFNEAKDKLDKYLRSIKTDGNVSSALAAKGKKCDSYDKKFEFYPACRP